MAQTVARSHLKRSTALAAAGRYGLAVACVAIAIGLALVAHTFERVLLSLAIVVVTWNLGTGPAVLAVLLATACYDYFVAPPLYAFHFTSQDVRNLIVFAGWGAVVIWFVGARRRIEDDLRRREHEVQQLNQELARHAAELDASNKELESFAYSVSHDLRAPLRHMAGYAELLQKQASPVLDDKSRHYMQTILAAAKRMGNLIDDLLAFSRIGRAEARMTTVSLDELVREVVAEIASETKGREIAWKIGPLPVCHGDRSMLKLVIANLVSNAVKFTRVRDKPEIEIGCVDKGDGEVEIYVADNGAGFDMQYAHKLFGVFQRLHHAEEFEGTGIGLATVQRIVHRHGGTVRAKGVVDEGARFCFSLPRAREAADGTAETA